MTNILNPLNIISGLLLILLNFSVYAETTLPIKDIFSQFVKQHLPQETIGFIIREPFSGKVIFEHHVEENFYPASNTKLYTAAAAFKYLGNDFKYLTSMHYHKQKVNKEQLTDKLYFVFRGDPSLHVTDIYDMFSDLKAKGISKIDANIVIDNSAFQSPDYAPGWTWDSIPWYYSAPINSIIINENKLRFSLAKTQKIYSKIKVKQLGQKLPKFKLNTNITAVSLEESQTQCQLNIKVNKNQFNLNGCWPINSTPKAIDLSFDDPKLLAKTVIDSALSAAGIKFSGKIVFGNLPANIPAMVKHSSIPLDDILEKVLADSNNVYTESLTKTIGLLYAGNGSFVTGTHAIQQILSEQLKLDLTAIALEDGSGQSRYNLVTPYHISELLHKIYHDPMFKKYYLALSKSGVSGQLKYRMASDKYKNKVAAKTGSARGTSALSGFVTNNNGKKYIFSLLINQSTKNYTELKRLEDKLLKEIISNSNL